jgi:hypothetical protein
MSRCGLAQLLAFKARQQGAEIIEPRGKTNCAHAKAIKNLSKSEARATIAFGPIQLATLFRI